MPRQTDVMLDDLIRFYENYYEDLGVPKCFVANEIAAEAVEYGDEKAYDYLKNFLKDDDTHIRYVGIAALRECGKRDGIKILKEYLKDEKDEKLKKTTEDAIRWIACLNDNYYL